MTFEQTYGKRGHLQPTRLSRRSEAVNHLKSLPYVHTRRPSSRYTSAFPGVYATCSLTERQPCCFLSQVPLLATTAPQSRCVSGLFGEYTYPSSRSACLCAVRVQGRSVRVNGGSQSFSVNCCVAPGDLGPLADLASRARGTYHILPANRLVERAERRTFRLQSGGAAARGKVWTECRGGPSSEYDVHHHPCSRDFSLSNWQITPHTCRSHR